MVLPLRVGVVGVGHLGFHHARLYSEILGVHLAGVVDVNEDRAMTTSNALGVPYFTDIEEFIEKCHPHALSIVVPTSLHFSISKLDPSYRVFFEDDMMADVSPDIEKNYKLFDKFEKNGGEKLKKYMENAKEKYDIAVKEFLYRDYNSTLDFLNARTLLKGSKLSVLSSLDKMVSKYFSDHRSKKIVEYAMVFLGNSPDNAPALYSMMSHVDLNLGVFFPDKGIYEVVESLVKLADEFNVKIEYNANVSSVNTDKKGNATSVGTDDGRTFEADAFLMCGDYAHTETEVLDKKFVTYDEKYWKKKVFAPSMMILFIGVNKKIEKFAHHNLFLADDWNKHFSEIFDKPQWPENPSWYLSVTSRTDKDCAPAGCDNFFVLVPVAPGLEDDDDTREAYAEKIITAVEQVAGEPIRPHIDYKRIYTHRDFTEDYHAWEGTALSIAHTLNQTAVFRPSRKSKKIRNLFYAGHYTHPGVGVPMAFISGELSAQTIGDHLK